jgi:hypothetical protein
MKIIPKAAVPRPQAAVNCPDHQLVWLNTRTPVYHTQDDPFFGNTASGKFVCKKEAESDGAYEFGSGVSRKAQ